MMKDRPNRLSIETDVKTGESKVEVAGTVTQLLFNLTVLTAQVCDETGIPPEIWAATLPGTIKGYKNVILKGKVAVDYSRLRNGGGTP